jgi:cytochrome P450
LEAAQTYGDLVHFPVGKKRHLYLVSNLDHIRYILLEHPEQFGRGLVFKRRAGRIVGTGLITSEGEFNQRQRRLIMPAFHYQRIIRYSEIMVQETERLLADWESGQQRDIHHDMTRVTMNIVTRTLFGADVFEASSDLGKAITDGIEYLNDEALLEPKEAIDTLNQTIGNIIATRRASGKDQGDLLSMLLLARDEDGSQMTDEQLRDEAMTLFLAGHETSANSISWTWYLLSQHPAVEAKLHDELERVLGGRTPTIHDLPQLPYADMVIKEVLRLYPPLWNLSRDVLEEVQFGGYTLPKGSALIISPFIVQRNSQYWEEPERFDPERFATGYEKQVQRGAYFPFSYGPRVCIGQGFATTELQLMLATIAQRYRLILETDQVAIEPFISLRPKGGLPMTIHARLREQV